MKLALHRSITFWSGILVMGFACWVWRDSWTYTSQATYGPTTVRLGYGAVSFWKLDTNLKQRIYRAPAFINVNQTDDFNWKQLEAPHFINSQDVAGSDFINHPFGKIASLRRLHEMLFVAHGDFVWIMSIPLWLVLLAFAVPWSAMLVWQASRRKRITSGSV